MIHTVMYRFFRGNILSKMKVYIYIKSVLCESFSENILERPLVHTEFKIDKRLAGDYGDDVSKKSNRRDEI